MKNDFTKKEKEKAVKNFINRFELDCDRLLTKMENKLLNYEGRVYPGVEVSFIEFLKYNKIPFSDKEIYILDMCSRALFMPEDNVYYGTSYRGVSCRNEVVSEADFKSL